MQHIDKPTKDQITTFEAFWNICNTIQGLPILSIAYVIQCGGIVSLITLILVSCTSCYTSYLIVLCMYSYDDEGGHLVQVRRSFVDIGRAVWTENGSTLIFVTQVVQLTLICSLYPFIVGSVVDTLFCDVRIPSWAWILLSALLFMPNAFITNLSQVAWTSVAVIISAAVIFASVLVYCFAHVEQWDWSVLLAFSSNKFPVAVMWLMSSYFSQPFVAVIEEPMRQRSRFGFILSLAFVGMTLVNIFMGVIAAVTFFPGTKEVVINNLPPGTLKTVIALTATLLSFASFTLPMFTVFEILEQYCTDTLQTTDTNLCSSTRRVIYRCLVVELIILLATIPKFSTVVAFFSSVTGTSLELIFPTVFHIKLYYDSIAKWQLALDVIILIFGITMLACGVYFSARTLFGASVTDDPPCLHQYTQEP